MSVHRPPYTLALDQGTTSTRALVFDGGGSVVAEHRLPLRQIYPADGWVEHDPLEIATAAEAVLNAAAEAAPGPLAAIGITNQRETIVLWDRATGRPLHNAIVWQDRRTAEACAGLKARGLEPEIARRTGLLLDPYFSGTKLAWLLDHIEGARARAARGELAAGTIDSWLIWRLTGGAVHATDATNASRTMLFDINTGVWDAFLLDALGVPSSVLPEVCDTAHVFGAVASGAAKGVPIGSAVGDQQAATLGQAALGPGLMKATYGTGCFALAPCGPRPVRSGNRLLGTVASRFSGTTAYALEGSIFMAGATVQWLRDGLNLFRQAAETEQIVQSANPVSRVILVPAFVGLGAPYWDPEARGAILNMTRADGRSEIVKAGLESVSLQTRDLLEAMEADLAAEGLPAPAALRVDGGMVANDWFCQNLADLTGRVIERPAITETTALGAALAAGLATGQFGMPDDMGRFWKLERRFEPRMEAGARDAKYALWREAVARVRTAGA